MSRLALAPRYRSGDDVAIEIAGVRFRFSTADFAARVAAAATRLRFVRRAELGPAELHDLVALAARGVIAEPASPLASHVSARADELVGFPGDLVHWLRRLVFHGAWIDQQIADGWLEPVFESPGGFRYRSAATGRCVSGEGPSADWSAAEYHASGV